MLGHSEQLAGAGGSSAERHALDDQLNRPRVTLNAFAQAMPAPMDVGAVVGGMEANGIQRTPISVRSPSQHNNGNAWRQQSRGMQQSRQNFNPQRQPFPTNPDRSFTTFSSVSENEVENMLGSNSRKQGHGSNARGWMPASGTRNPQARTNQQAFVQQAQRRNGSKFRPANIR
ncbi:hypothetical protein K474DRAFT_555046 [Panus rudis PR-1116 ss-1]|nr:hypothetical protein K474DRAFT_555046 [Panus rudis PR-1116 ss-1]